MSDKARARLEGLKKTIAANDRLAPAPCLSEEQVEAFERDNGVRLPEDYRLFLQVVGNGVHGESKGHVAVYPIDPLDTWLDDAPGMPTRGNLIRGDLRQPFPHARGIDYDIEGFPDDFDEDAAAASTSPGKVFVCHEGCGIYWVLVVTGQERGNMWVEHEYSYAPTEPRMGFLEWCERWADRGWTEGLVETLLGGGDDD